MQRSWTGEAVKMVGGSAMLLGVVACGSPAQSGNIETRIRPPELSEATSNAAVYTKELLRSFNDELVSESAGELQASYEDERLIEEGGNELLLSSSAELRISVRVMDRVSQLVVQYALANTCSNESTLDDSACNNMQTSNTYAATFTGKTPGSLSSTEPLTTPAVTQFINSTSVSLSTVRDESVIFTISKGNVLQAEELTGNDPVVDSGELKAYFQRVAAGNSDR